MQLPMREKYVDETVGIWFIFGEHPGDFVDISDGTKDILLKIPRSVAEKLIDAQENFRKDLYAILC